MTYTSDWKVGETRIMTYDCGTASITKIKETTAPGVYKRTELDDMKDAADMLLKYVDNGKYTVLSRVKLKEGRGIKLHQQYEKDAIYYITRRELDKLSNKYKIQCDF